jgi:biopolymer transport protein ExbD
MSLLSRRPPRRRIVFMLTPLVDVMFLLLIFFMLSSQTAPYSLLEIMAQGAPGQDQQAQQAASATPPTPAAQVLVSIARGYARFNGTRVEMADLPSAIESYKTAGFTTAVVTTGDAATVQDVVTVLEALERGAFAEMRLMTQAVAP